MTVMRSRITQSVSALALGTALCMLALPVTVSSQTEGGFSLGLQAGGLKGSTELTDKASAQAGLVVRRPLAGILLAELGGRYARLDGTNYATDLAVGELRFLLAKRSGTVRPVVYAGVGASRHNLKTEPPQRTADVDPLGVTALVPVGLGLQFVLGNSTALEILGGYTYSLGDDLNGATFEKGNDTFWGMTVGLTFGHFGPGEKEERPASRPASRPALMAPSTPGPSPEPQPEFVAEAVVAPVAVEPPATPVVGTPRVSEQPAVAGLSLAPVYFATGSARVGPNGRSLIAEFVKTIESNDVVLLEVRGYTDSRGSRKRNLRLALQRAAAVKAVLVDLGIDGWQISIRAIGETEPQSPGVWHSRRVEITAIE